MEREKRGWRRTSRRRRNQGENEKTKVEVERKYERERDFYKHEKFPRETA